MNKKNDADLAWHEVETHTLCTTKIFTINEATRVAPDGSRGAYVVMDANDWVIVVPVVRTGGAKSFTLVRQWRHGSTTFSLEFPGGVIEKGEDIETAAKRELEEETGLRAGTMTHLGSVYPNPAIMSNKVHFFAADDITDTKTQHLDRDEFIQTVTVGAREVFAAMGTGEYTHALMGTALLLYLQKFPLD